MNCQPESEIAPGRYIVAFKPDVLQEQRDSHCAWAQQLHLQCISDLGIAESDGLKGVSSQYVFGYFGTFHDSMIKHLKAAEEVCGIDLHNCYLSLMRNRM